MNHMRRAFVTAAMAVWIAAGGLLAQGLADPLEQGFRAPPDSAKPRTWWHWTNGNVTQEGITKDLEWMKRVGIAGMQLADVASGSGQTVEPKIEFGSVPWLDAVRHAASEAQRLGLEMAIFSSAGWSETGGPWVRPEQAMKKLVWSQTEVTGPRRFSERLAQPPSNNGPIRNLRAGGGRGNPPPDPTWYADSAVVAYPTPGGEANVADLHPKVTSSAGDLDAAPLLDDDLNSTVTVPAPQAGGPAWVQFEFAQPFASRAITLSGRSGIPVGRVLVSQDGMTFTTLVTLPGAQLYRQGRVRTFAFSQVSARFYRIEMTGSPLGPAETMSQAASAPAKEYVLAEAMLHSGARVHRWEEKAGFSFLFEYESVGTPEVPLDSAVRRSQVIDLTSKMGPDGTLEWDVPAGRWTILRMGSSLTGAKNRPAPASGLGYEADKLSRRHMEAYYHGYVDPLAKALGPLFGKGLQYMLMDSWEAGMQNWTDGMIAEFRTRRGYDPTPFLPALAGRIVDNAQTSDRFLWDFRRTLADMWADYHYGVMADLLRRQGLGLYAEAAGVSLEIPEDTLLNKSKVDVPMAEFWVRALHPEAMYLQDVRGAASAAHVYAKTLAAAEAFTGGGYESPYTLKKVADYWFAQGINRLVFHTSAHQPLDTKPGNTMVGTHLHRNITWAGQAGPFMTYLARNSFMLQQGLFVADLAYLLNEGAPSTMPFWGAGLQPKVPEGYDFDYINADVLLHRMSVREDGRLVLPDGMSYRVLVLPQVDCMTLPVLRKISSLVKEGATVVGPRPVRSPSLAGSPAADSELRSLAEDLWGDLDGVSRTRRVCEKGLVVWGLPLAEVLTSLGLARDVEADRPMAMDLPWIHRRSGDSDIYFLANRTDRAADLDVRFRVSGRQAEFWHSDTGLIEPAEYDTAAGLTTVPLRLAQRESVFVVFRRAAESQSRVLPHRITRTLATLAGPWQVRFPAGLGAPERIQLADLESWTVHPDEGVKYFSGTATYSRQIEVEQAWLDPKARIMLDLGVVGDLAEVSANGKAFETLWKPPFRVDVTEALRPGTNDLEIKVTNEWTNRLAGDRMVPVDKRVLGAGGPAMGGFGRPASVLESGLIGPVTVVEVTTR